MREYTITVYQPDYAVVEDAAYDEVTKPLLGYVGENEGTELTINLPADWTGSFYLDWHTSDGWTLGTTAYTGTEIVYEVPDDYMVAGDVYLRIRIVDSTSTMYTDPIKFVVKP